MLVKKKEEKNEVHIFKINMNLKYPKNIYNINISITKFINL
jgi:hypothetical protein